MRIGIDARFFGSGHTGLGRYSEELISHLAANANGHELVVFLRPDAARASNGMSANVEVRRTDINHYSVSEQVALTRELGHAGVDLMHFMHFNYPLPYRGRFVLSINDLILLHYPGRQRSARLRVPAMRLVLKAGVRRSDAIIAISEHQKRLILNELGAPEEKVFVTHIAVKPCFTPPATRSTEELRRRLGVEEAPLVLYVGQWRKHRNVPRLIEAFSLVRKHMDARLVLVGAPDRLFSEVRKAFLRHGVENAVITLGFVEDEELPAVYGAADVLVFPSLVEGFGLPPLEAMACGTPVASSKAPPMPEVLADAPAYFDPLDVDEMASTMLAMLESEDLRAVHRERGLERAREFSWHRTALATMEVYESVLAASRK